MFIGDSRIRQVYKSFISRFDEKFDQNDYTISNISNQKTSTVSITTISGKRLNNFKIPTFNYSTDLLSDSDDKNYIYTSSKLNLEIVRFTL